MDKMRYCLIFLCLALLAGSASAAAPVANFTATPLTGIAPLTVSFTDLSLNDPNGWAWYFGDETYTAPWTEMNTSAGWSARYLHTSVSMPDGSIVLMGGAVNSTLRMNDVWRSTDNGASWTQLPDAGWSARYFPNSVSMPDGSIVLMGGRDQSGIYKNDVWRSTDNGASWTQLPDAGWTVRYRHSSVSMPDGSIVLTGGRDGGAWPSNLKNDVWRSTDNGASWTQLPDAGWSARHSHTSVVIPDGSIVLMGGSDSNSNKNDVWRSTDNGTTWTQLPDAGWSARYGHSSVSMPDGSIMLMGGYDSGNEYKNDVWRSTDNGASWTQLPNAMWTARAGHSSVAMTDGSIILIGGADGSVYKNDVWRFLSAGSSEQDQSHTYNAAGTYNVSLQAYNTEGYNSSRKTEYITVGIGALPLPGFTNPPTDPNGDGLFEDLNANGFADWDDAVVLFWNTDWIQDNEPVPAFDFNHNGFIDWDDAVVLFWEV